MKPRGYRVRVASDHVVVEHRESIRPRTIVAIAIFYAAYSLQPQIRHALAQFYKQRDPMIGCFVISILLFPLLPITTGSQRRTGEVFYCSAEKVYTARRRMLGVWHRGTFTVGNIHQLQREFRRNSSKNGISMALTFYYAGQKVDVLENCPLSDAIQVLEACRSLGIDVKTEGDTLPMAKDIGKRGWWSNPWRPVSEDEHQTKQ